MIVETTGGRTVNIGLEILTTSKAAELPSKKGDSSPLRLLNRPQFRGCCGAPTPLLSPAHLLPNRVLCRSDWTLQSFSIGCSHCSQRFAQNIHFFLELAHSLFDKCILLPQHAGG